MHVFECTRQTGQEVLAELNTSLLGLSQKEAVLRQEKYGLNEVRAKGTSFIDIVMHQCASPFFYLLLGAGILSFFIGEKIDCLVIFIFIAINLVLGFVQEFRAERTISLLKNIISPTAKVFRDGQIQIIGKREIVVGDLVVLAQGDIVPAEIRVLEVSNFLVDESALTGESMPVAKTRENILFAGTSVMAGKAKGVVVAVGKDTALGGIITSVKERRPQGIYEKNLAYFCRLMLKIVLVTVVLVFVLNMVIKGPNNLFEFLLFCVALVVSILPEALPAVVILALSRGSLKMASQHVVVKRLPAIEDLGNIEILCTDKTGTLTQNKLSLEKIVSAENNKVLLYGLLGADAKTNPFDAALFERSNYAVVKELKKYAVVSELPFDSFRMCASVLVTDAKGQKILVTKGAPEMVLKLCSKFEGNYTLPTGRQAKKELLQSIAREGQDGKRVLLLAYKKVASHKTHGRENHGTVEITKSDEKAMTFLGYFVYEDPLKTTAQEAITLAKKLGVQIKIITGDSGQVAGFVAKKTGLIIDQSAVVPGADLEKMSGDEFDNACQDFSVFARVSPDIKHKIIKSLQKKYEVGFLGEGINDVPALKTANVGIAVAEATDIAKEAADIVLLKKDLRVIINGIKDGRTIFANINKYIKCALASNFGNFYSIAAISLFIPFLPMLPIQILLGNILSDLPLLAIVSDHVDVEELRKPKAYQLHNMLPLIISLALVSTVFDFIFFIIFYKSPATNIQTLWFVESILTEIALIFIIRTRKKFWKAKKPGFTLVFFTIIDALAIVILPFTKFGQNVFHFVGAPVYGLLIVLMLLVFYVALSEIVKLVYFHYFKPPKLLP